MKKELRTDFTNRQYMIHKDFEIYYYSDRNFSDVHAHTHDYYEFYFYMGGFLPCSTVFRMAKIRLCAATAFAFDQTLSRLFASGTAPILAARIRHFSDS